MQTVYDPVGEFEAMRPRLEAIAYRMLGSRADAEDAVQETFIRWHSAPQGDIAVPEAWLFRTCTRVCIDALRSAYRKRESYVGPWLPEPIVAMQPAVLDPSERADSLSIAFLLLLERLSPLERAAFLLHDIFDYRYDDLADVLGRAPATCRQLVSRARRHLREGGRRFDPAPEAAVSLSARFLAAAGAGEIGQLEAMLTEDAELWSDGGGEVAAARNVIVGGERVARFLAGIAQKERSAIARPAWVNGSPGAVILLGQRVLGVITPTFDSEGRIDRVFVIVNPDKLSAVP